MNVTFTGSKYLSFQKLNINCQFFSEICKNSFKIHEINSIAAYYTKVLLVNEKVSSGEVQLLMGQ